MSNFALSSFAIVSTTFRHLLFICLPGAVYGDPQGKPLTGGFMTTSTPAQSGCLLSDFARWRV